MLLLSPSTPPAGTTYPQEGPIDLEAFKAYFFGATCILGIISSEKYDEPVDGQEVDVQLNDAIGGRKWEECLGGCFYV